MVGNGRSRRSRIRVEDRRLAGKEIIEGVGQEEEKKAEERQEDMSKMPYL